MKAMSQTMIHHKMTSTFFFWFMEHVPRVLDIDLLHIFNIVVVLQWEMIAYARRNKKLFH
jgi:hypothetical protein